MTQQWHPPGEQPDDTPQPPDRHGAQGAPGRPAEPPVLSPPTPVLGIISLVIGVIGVAATLVPILRLPGALAGLVAATLGVVTWVTKGLGGRMFAAGGVVLGLAAVPMAVVLFVQSLAPQSPDPQVLARDDTAPTPSTQAPSPGSASPSPTATPSARRSSTVVLEVIGQDGPVTAEVEYSVKSSADVEAQVAKVETRLPFRKQLTVGDPSEITLWAYARTPQPKGSLTCLITVNDKVLEEGHSKPVDVQRVTTCDAWANPSR
ncbi:MAG TPA: hypothetical protein VFV66_26080 [Nonomuraea sp.]|nr:hypothetical protein [Nonomuraea sp.]